MTAPAAGNPLDVYLWEARPVLLFAPELGNRQMSQQVAVFANASDAITERDMAVLLVTGDSGDPHVRFGPAALKFVPPEPGPANDVLRERYSVPEDQFTVILVGKDGGEKTRWTSVVDPQTIFQQVDSMPMRQREMGNGS